MKQLTFLATALLAFHVASNATPTFIEQNVATVQNADAELYKANVEINGYRCNLYTDATFTIQQITSISSPDLTVPYTITYEGKEYHCNVVNMSNLVGRDSEDDWNDTKIAPNVKSVTFSDGIKTLKGTFYLNRSLKVTIPKSVSAIEEETFNRGISSGYIKDEEEHNWWLQHYNTNYTTYDIEEFVVDKDNPYYTAHNGILYTKDMKTLVSCPRYKAGKITVPEGVEKLGTGCFSACNRITEIQLPESINNIGAHSFYYCLNLQELNIPEGIGTLYEKTFSRCVKLESLVLPASLKALDVQKIGNSAPVGMFTEMYSLKELDMENTQIEVLGKEEDNNVKLFTNLPVENFKLPKHIRKIGNNALRYINTPTALHLYSSIESMGENIIDPFQILTADAEHGGISRTICSQTNSPLKDIYCYWTAPIEVNDRLFTYVKVKKGKYTIEMFPQDWANICTIHVPKGTTAIYKTHAFWGKFKNIVEFDATTSIPNTENMIALKPITYNAVYNLQGIKVAAYKGQLKSLKSGIYIVGGKKITVK